MNKVTWKVRLKDDRRESGNDENALDGVGLIQFGGRVETFERYGLKVTNHSNTVERGEVQIMAKDTCCGTINATVRASVGSSRDTYRPEYSCASDCIRDSDVGRSLVSHGGQELYNGDKLLKSGCKLSKKVRWKGEGLEKKEREWLFRLWIHWGTRKNVEDFAHVEWKIEGALREGSEVKKTLLMLGIDKKYMWFTWCSTINERKGDGMAGSDIKMQEFFTRNTDPCPRVEGLELWPVDEVVWKVSKDKIVISEFKPGDYGFQCWKREKKDKMEDWIWMGPVVVECRKIDNNCLQFYFR
jgi:hypothetical protein